MDDRRIQCFVGAERHAAARRHLAGRELVEDASAARWPFRRHVTPQPSRPAAVWIHDLHLAFPAGQRAGTRLVLTQSTYQLQRWLDWLDDSPDVLVVADADYGALLRSAPEVSARRGPWQRIDVVGDPVDAGPAPEGAPDEAATADLHAAFQQSDPRRRFDACTAAISRSPEDAALQLAFASACMELQLLGAAGEALAHARQLAPEWEAVHFESGKLWLRLEDTGRAAAAFAEAARLMPRFAAALLNLGGALGEMGRAAEALEALARARTIDPRSHTVLNNIGAVHREEGRLEEAARAFREVIALAPAFVFGYYNLGHTLLLMGDFEAARDAYEEGFARDAQKNPRQAARLAVARAAARDGDGALRLVAELGERLPADRAREIFEEAESTLEALSAVPGVDAAAIGRVLAGVRRYSS